MLIKVKKGWELPESAAMDEGAYRNRRDILRQLSLAGFLAGTTLATGIGGRVARAAETDPSANLYPVPANSLYQVPERPLTAESDATTYNNFYEFGSHKRIYEDAQALKIRPWDVVIDGMVESPMTLDIDTLLRKVQLEERVYRHRCVERWAMTVPWSGFPMSQLVDIAKPLSGAKYVKMQTLADEETMPNLSASWYPWPYTEGVTMAEATNDLTFLVTGLYGKPVPKQNGAPLRLALPWKYGFKSVKSIVRFTFTDERPVSYWEELQASEYGFWANVNPDVPHPRWSQAEEQLLTSGDVVPTQIYNGYGEFVAHLYDGMQAEFGDRLFR
ncbi:protein-methionine-sulfoxide reductase catalytic subunit MsrP [Pacificispira sp.]|uniref:protein-methionine-sulfoxide reductase catalytic subunit MsrP n=1 Tax=Pacificispira sp. TaxID=2888761 RepID=UPI003BAA7131